MRIRTAAASLVLPLVFSPFVAVGARADDPPADDGSSEAAAVRIKITQGRGDDRKGVTGRLSSANPDCVADQRVTFYRQVKSDSGEVLSERRIGYSLVEPLADGSKKSKVIRFGLSRSGSVIGRTAPTDACLAGKSNVVNYRRP